MLGLPMGALLLHLIVHWHGSMQVQKICFASLEELTGFTCFLLVESHSITKFVELSFLGVCKGLKL